MFNKVIVSVVGSSNSGKTTAIEVLIKALTKKGYTIASAKRIPEPEFTIDTKGKDTHRHSQAGANPVLSVAPNELTIIKKTDTSKLSLEQLIEQIPEETDIIILEGFKGLVADDSSIPKLVSAKTADEITQAPDRFKNILAFVSSIENPPQTEIPIVDPLKEPEKLVDLVYNKVAVLVERKRKREEKITIQVEEQMLPLGDFVQDIVRNAVLGMVGSLKGVKIKGEEKVSIVIKRLKRG
ncbi:MAG: molybdopterin-guanine dinucleotide biosynthesis protein B [Candidatus Bathyarchaeota archaeon]|nr:molybdopterin-guanine dinucleotide biosynthesis protein B [Candidatus Bathyarchaeota archaeon]